MKMVGTGAIGLGYMKLLGARIVLVDVTVVVLDESVTVSVSVVTACWI